MVDYTKRPAAPSPPPPAPAGGVSLSKLSLTKSSPSVSLDKRGGASGHMRVNLNWTQPQGGGGLFRKAKTIDLDLGCLWELRSGEKGVIQALGNAFGSLDAPPFIHLDGDDRSGSATGGENLTINLEHLADFRRILVFAYIYEGAPAWDQADGVVTMYPQGAAPIEVRLDEHSGARMCALALLESTGSGLTIQREVRYVNGSQSDLDRAYGWGMNWSPGRK